MTKGSSKAHPARLHHYVPRKLLAAFCDTQAKLVWVHDMEHKWSKPLSPARVAAETDYNRIDLPGYSPDEVEKAFSRIEGAAWGPLKRLSDVGQPPAGTDREAILHFIALMRARSPAGRRALELNIDLNVQVVNAMDQRADRTDGAVAELKRHFQHVWSTPEARRNTIVLGGMVRSSQELVPIWDNLQWSLLMVDTVDADFVCSDSPVGIQVQAPGRLFDGIRSANIDSIVTFPVTPKIALVGMRYVPASRVAATLRDVAAINGITVKSARRYVYSLQQDFVWLCGDGSLKNAARDLFDLG